MAHSTSSSRASALALPLRKRAIPHHSSISPTRRASLLFTLPVSPAQDQDNLADLASAWNDLTLSQYPEGLDDKVQRYRDCYYIKLLDVLNTAALLLYAEEPLSDLATAWEKKVWCETYKGAYDLDAYEDAMEKQIDDLEFWIEEWEDGDGKEVFGDYVIANFGELGQEVMNAVVQGENEEREIEVDLDMDMEGEDRDVGEEDVSSVNLCADDSGSEFYDV
ncbi:hypothetical protein A1F96_02273 [Pyrenophora tritici-repentis]|nr:hypothetical protein A1F96_02273 [Pyrenophora tritici-repentis]